MIKKISRKNWYERNRALAIFLQPNEKGRRLFVTAGDLNGYLLNQKFESDWNILMQAYEKIHTLKSNESPPPNGIMFAVSRIEISHSIFIEFLVSSNGKWIMVEANWSSPLKVIYYHHNSNNSTRSNAKDFQDAVWRGITDFCMIWCKVYKY